MSADVVPVDLKGELIMNGRPTYLCGGLYTFLGAVAAIGTVERFAKHPAVGSLLLVGGSAVLLFAGILVIREIVIQRALQGPPIEPLPQCNQLGVNAHALSKTDARAVSIDLLEIADRTSERSLDVEVGTLQGAECNHTGSHEQASRAVRRSPCGNRLSSPFGPREVASA